MLFQLPDGKISPDKSFCDWPTFPAKIEERKNAERNAILTEAQNGGSGRQIGVAALCIDLKAPLLIGEMEGTRRQLLFSLKRKMHYLMDTYVCFNVHYFHFHFDAFVQIFLLFQGVKFFALKNYALGMVAVENGQRLVDNFCQKWPV